MTKKPDDTTGLRFVLVGGRLCHVSEFSALRPKDRPDATCPACDEQVIMHLGPRHTHHYQHRPSAVCALTNPETALHFNTKVHICEQLRKGHRLLLSQSCGGFEAPTVGRYEGGHMNCARGRTRAGVWVSDWTRVEMEKYAGSRKPDIVLYRGGEVLAAVEVCVTHAIDEDKAADLLACGVKWVEIKADEDFDWSIEQPLEWWRMHPALAPWVCEDCQTAPSKYAERVREQIRRDAERGRERARLDEERREQIAKYYGTKNWIKYAKTIFVYRDGGQIEKHEIHICERTEKYPAHEVAAVFLRYGMEGRIIAEEPAPLTSEGRQRINEAYRDWRATLGTMNPTAETPGWLSQHDMTEELRRWRHPYKWDAAKRDWVKVESLGDPFPPSDTEDSKQ